MSIDRFTIKLAIGLIAMLFILSAKVIYADDLGVMGETYIIKEIDFLDFIQSRAHMMQQNGQWQMIQDHIQQDAKYYRDRPRKVKGITRSYKTKSWTFDPG